MANEAAESAKTGMEAVEFPIESWGHFFEYWAKYGQQMIVTLVMLVVGIVLLQKLGPRIKRLAGKTKFISNYSSEITVGFYAVGSAFLFGLVLWNLGVGGIVVRQLLMAAALAAAAVSLLLKRFMPKMPFKVGNMIKTGDLLGKVEDISLLNTRLKTFDGRMVLVPNALLFNDYLVNYHTTPTRRVKIDIAIKYDEDIVRAKRIMEAVMVQDPRVLPTPRPVVYTMNLDDSWVQLGGRGWVKNPKAWVARCEILEKIKYAFDNQGISIAFPRRDVHVFSETPDMAPNPSDPEEIVASMMAQPSTGGS